MIKMRVNRDKESICFNCCTTWKNTPEMYDLAIGKENHIILPLCQKCIRELFTKTLKADVKYNAKLKSDEDSKRIMNFKKTERNWWDEHKKNDDKRD